MRGRKGLWVICLVLKGMRLRRAEVRSGQITWQLSACNHCVVDYAVVVHMQCRFKKGNTKECPFSVRTPCTSKNRKEGRRSKSGRNGNSRAERGFQCRRHVTGHRHDLLQRAAMFLAVWSALGQYFMVIRICNTHPLIAKTRLLNESTTVDSRL